MGEKADLSLRGLFYLGTNAVAPFAKDHPNDGGNGGGRSSKMAEGLMELSLIISITLLGNK
jgi:hypothetical protein